MKIKTFGNHFGNNPTQTQKKYLLNAYEWAINNKKNDVRVNRVLYSFDFSRNEVAIKTVGDVACCFYKFCVVD